jgi:hypothetical protein
LSSQNPFEITRWEASKQPEEALLARWLQREGLEYQRVEHPPKTHTPEVKYDTPVIRVVVSGAIQYSFPGYGVVELRPGDRLDLTADLLHDIKVISPEPAVTLDAVKA